VNDDFPRSMDAASAGGVAQTPSEAPLGDSVSEEVDVELDDTTSETESVHASSPPTSSPSPSSPPTSPSSPPRPRPRVRPRMTLRIPDDEVARPLSAPPPEASAPSRAEIAPHRIITINSPQSDVMRDLAPVEEESSPPPRVAPRAPSSPTLPDSPISSEPTLASEPEPTVASEPEPEVTLSDPVPAESPPDIASVAALSAPPPPEPRRSPSVRLPVPRPSPSAPAPRGENGSGRPPGHSPLPPRPVSVTAPRPPDTDQRLPDPEDTAEVPSVPSEELEEDAASVAPTPPPAPPQTGSLGLLPPIPTPPAVPRRLSSTPATPTPALVSHVEGMARHPVEVTSTEPDSLDIPVEEDEEFSRVSEPEIAAEDVVSVESTPNLTTPKRVPPPPAPKKSSIPPVGMQSSPNVSSLLTSATSAGPQPNFAVSGEISVVRTEPPPPDPSDPLIIPPLEEPTPPPALVMPPPAAAPAPPPAAHSPYGEIAPPPMNEAAAAARKRGRPWWEELFNDDFIRTMAKISDEQISGEADFIEDSLGVAKGAMILDLACGTGRHAIELTRRGYQVVGYDLSLPMLARAADEAQDRNQKLNFVQGDMREMTFEETFDGIYSWNTSFGFFEEDKNAQVVGRVHRALRKGGQFLLDVANRDYVGKFSPSLAWFEGEGCICMDEMQLDWITSRMKVKRTMMMDDGRSKEIEYSIRLYSLHELGRLLHDHGFRVAEVSGRASTPGVFFGCDSPRTLILAEKR
jgi:SAM-dependent methyltransferase